MSRCPAGGDVQDDTVLVLGLIAIAAADPLQLLDHSVVALGAGVGDARRRRSCNWANTPQPQQNPRRSEVYCRQASWRQGAV
jgi:hypothetical protein